MNIQDVLSGDKTWAIAQGDVLERLRDMPDECVQVCVTSPPYYALRSYLPEGHADKGAEMGSEATPEAYLDKMVEVFGEVRRVLRRDGVCFINLGDSYAGSWGNYAPGGIKGKQREQTEGGKRWERKAYDNTTRLPATANVPGLKPKDLMMMPARLALALQSDGWWLRSEITLCKVAPMPESVQDRPTSATEKLYLLAKSPTYFYDAEAVRVGSSGRYNGSTFTNGKTAEPHDNVGQGERVERSGRNMWNWMYWQPEPFEGAHFATFPSSIPRLAVRAGSSERGCCAECGAPWVRCVEREASDWETRKAAGATSGSILNGHNASHGNGTDHTLSKRRSTTTGWRPSCSHLDAPIVPCVVLDPFAGSGTSLSVAVQLGRRALGIELSPEYIRLAERRMAREAAGYCLPFDVVMQEEG